MLPHMVAFLLMGKTPPACEGIRIYIAKKLLRIANVLHIAALTQPPVKQYYSFYTSISISRHIESSQKMICHVKKEVKSTVLQVEQEFSSAK